jgi:2,3-bisphosphoglycerate-dependent phosphoglycerate mutase
MDKAIYLTLMRHGRSRADDEGVHEGHYDSPLTQVGINQVERRAREWVEKQVHFDRIIASTLQRAARTAEIIGQILGVPVELDEGWMEVNNGPLAGLPFAEARERFPVPDFRNPYETIHGTGESEWELYSRSARAVEKVIRRGPGRYLVVAHGGILNSALRTIVGTQTPINRSGIWFSFGDTGYARLDYSASSHIWVLRELIGD